MCVCVCVCVCGGGGDASAWAWRDRETLRPCGTSAAHHLNDGSGVGRDGPKGSEHRRLLLKRRVSRPQHAQEQRGDEDLNLSRDVRLRTLKGNNRGRLRGSSNAAISGRQQSGMAAALPTLNPRMSDRNTLSEVEETLGIVDTIFLSSPTQLHMKGGPTAPAVVMRVQLSVRACVRIFACWAM